LKNTLACAFMLLSLALGSCSSDSGTKTPADDLSNPDLTADQASPPDQTATDLLPPEDAKDTSEADQQTPPDATDVVDLATDTAEDTALDVADVASTPWTLTCGDIPILGPQGDLVSPECKNCVDTECCDLAEACAADADCKQMRDCMAVCDDSTCIDQCWTTYAAAQTLASAFTACRSTTCYAYCADTLCFGKVEAKQPEKEPYAVSLYLATTPDGNPVEGATIKHCANDDADCTNPLSTATSDGEGMASVLIPVSPSGYEGYLEISGPTIRTVLFHGFRYTNLGAITGNYINPTLPTIFPQSTINLISSMGNVTVDDSRAIIFFSTRGCAEAPLGNVTVTTAASDAQTKTVYISGGMPSTTATMTTSSDGSGVLFNVPTTSATTTVSGSFGGVTFSTLTVHVRPGTITTLDVVPTP